MYKTLIMLMSLAMFLCMAGNVSAQLLVYYKFDEKSGNTAFDSSTNHIDGIIEGNNDPNWTVGMVGGALGLNDIRITIPASNMNMTSSAGTVAFWMRMPADGPRGQINTLWWAGDNTSGSGFGPEHEMHIHVESAVAGIWQGGELAFRLQGDSPNWVHLHSDAEKAALSDDPGTAPINPILMGDGLWHHVAGTWGNDDDNAKLYLDGELIHEVPYVDIDPQYPFTNMYIGGMADWVAGAALGTSGGRPYIGELDEFQVYGSPLDANVIQELYADSLVPTLTASLPNPGNNQSEVALDTNLGWLTGDTAVAHHVYFGTDFNDVNQADLDEPRGVLAGQDLQAATFDPGPLAYNQTYYWRVDEVNDLPDSSIFRGQVWSFTTRNFILVDDFEDYDDANNTVFNRWADGFNDESNGSLISYTFGGEGPGPGEHYVETLFVHGGRQSGPFFYDNEMRYSEVALSFSGPEADFTRDGLDSLSLWFKGNPPFMGGYMEDPPGTYTISGAGRDIWGRSDEFHFVYKVIDLTSGNATIRARVESVVENSAVDGFTKAGVMVRDTLDPGASNVAVLLTPGNGARNQFRTVSGGSTDREFDPNIVAPYWVRAEMSITGLIRAYISQDGQDWTRFSLRTVTRADRNAPMYLGMAVTSHLPGETTQAVLSNVTITGPGSDGPWISQDIGIVSNSAQPMYVSLNDTPVFYQDPNTLQADPDATQIVEWTNWTIPLKDFEGQGVDLTNVTSLGVGIGDKANTSGDGGEGRIYLDDIRLYRPQD